jgi:hypothetical protein
VKALHRIFQVIASTVVLLVSDSAGRAAEQTEIPSFLRVLVVNNAERPVVANVQSGSITATIEMQQGDGRWRAVGKTRAPTRAWAIPELSEGEVRQFIIPDIGIGVPAAVRAAVGMSGETIYSQPFAAHVDPLTAGVRVDCWLARIGPAQPQQGPIMAAAKSKSGS